MEVAIHGKVLKGFVASMKNEKGPIKDMERQTKTVEKKRLDMDSATAANERSGSKRRKRKGKTETKEKQVLADTAFNAVVELLKAKHSHIPEYENAHLEDLKRLCGILATV